MFCSVQNNDFQQICRLLMIGIFVVFLSSCNYRYHPKNINEIDIQVATQTVDADTFNASDLQFLTFIPYKNNDKVAFAKAQNSYLFKITQLGPINQENALLLAPHYLQSVMYFDESLQLKGEFKRNTYQAYRDYSPNIIAFNHVGKISYLLIKNTISKPLYFSIENSKRVKAYDQKLQMTFTVVYSVILTLAMLHFIYFFFIRKMGYLLFSLYVLSVLYAILFQEGMISYFPDLSTPIFGSYTQVIWLKITSIIYWLFTIVFLDLKNRSKIDYTIAKVMMMFEIIIVVSLLMLAVFEVSGVYSYLASFINLFFIVAIIIAIYMPIKYAFLKVRQAKYLAIGVIIHMLTALMRIKYSMTLEPLAFWMPRAFEFGLLAEALILSFGLADKTMRVIKERDVAEKKVKLVDRELFSKELEKSFQQRSMNTIDKYFGTQAQLNQMINSYFISSLQQLVEVKDVLYVSENGNAIEKQYISGNNQEFNMDDFIKDNGELMNNICQVNIANYQANPSKHYSQLPFVIIPVAEKDYDNLCLFLSFPSYVEVDDNLLKDLTVFANTMSQSLLTVKKYQSTVETSRYDNLTQVFNRETILSKLDVLISMYNSSVSVAFIDLDDFKSINDDFGHDVGDEYLVFLCDTLKKEFNDDAFVGRYGGDEFLVVFNHYNRAKIENKFNAIYDYFAINPINQNTMNVSIGVAMMQNHPNLNAKELLKKADSALYQAKARGKNQFVFD